MKLYDDGQYQMNQILNEEAKIIACASDQVLEIPKLKIQKLKFSWSRILGINFTDEMKGLISLQNKSLI